MKNLFFLSILKVWSIYYCYGQSTFEVVLSGGVDTSLKVGGIIENPNGGYLVRSTAINFGPVTPFSADYLGTTIQWLDTEGNITNWRNYPTHIGCDFQDEFSDILIVSSNGDIILPYSKNHCFVECEPGSESWYTITKAMMSISNSSGDILNHKIYAPTCRSTDDIVGLKELPSGGFRFIYRDHRKLIIEELDSNFEELDVNIIDSAALGNMMYDTINNIIIGYQWKALKWYNLEGTLMTSFQTIGESEQFKNMTTEAGYIIVHLAKLNEVSHLLTYDLAGNLVSDKSFDDLYDFKDIKITPSGSFLTIEDLSQSYNDSISYPVRVRLFDSNLQLLAKKEYGSPFVHPEQLKLTSDGDFIVLGTKVGSLKFTNRFADEQYVLKQSYYDLLQTSTIEANSTKDFSVTISPNPTFGKSSYFVSNASAGNISYELFDAQGNIVQTAQAIPYQGEIDLTMYPPRMYIILMKDYHKSWSDIQKVIKL